MRQRAPVSNRILEALLACTPKELEGPLSACWTGRAFHNPFERPLLILAALRFLALQGGPAHPLWGALVQGRSDVTPPPRLAELLASSALQSVLSTRLLQTNELRRSFSWLWAAHLLGLQGAGRPAALADIGTSGGLNLVGDLLPHPWCLPDGRPLELGAPPTLLRRVGWDQAPLRPAERDDADWLRACIWVEDVGRLQGLERAMARLIELGPQVEVRQAGIEASTAQLDALADELPGDTFILINQSVVEPYLTPEQASRHQAALRRWLRGRPLRSAAWVALESSPEPVHEAALYLTLRTGEARVERRVLARCDYHPHVIRPDPAGPGWLKQHRRS